MRKVGLFVDLNKLYRNVATKYKGRKVDYKKFKEAVTDLGDCVKAMAYGHCKGTEADKFINTLRGHGYEPKYLCGPITETTRNAQLLEMMFDILDADLDTVVIAHPTARIIPLINRLKDRGTKTVVFACNIDPELLNFTVCMEVTADVLEEKK